MGYFKELATKLYEYDEEIISLLTSVRAAMPTVFALFFDDDLPNKVIDDYLYEFTSDKELIDLTVIAIEMDYIKFMFFDGDEETELTVQVPLNDHLNSPFI